MIGMARMGRPSMCFEAQEQIVARNHPPPDSCFVVEFIELTTGGLKVGSTIYVHEKLGRIKVTKEVREYDNPSYPEQNLYTRPQFANIGNSVWRKGSPSVG